MQSASKLSDLYAQHGTHVTNVLRRTQEAVGAMAGDEEGKAVGRAALEWPLDDLCALKFYLSALKRKRDHAKEAEELAHRNLMLTLKWRATNAAKLRSAQSLEKVPLFAKYRMVQWKHHLVCFQVYENMNEMFHECNNDTNVLLSITRDFNESVAHRLDTMSRDTGYLCKVINVVDIDRFASWTNINMKVMRALAETSRENDIYRPQMIHQIVATNVPGGFFLR